MCRFCVISEVTRRGEWNYGEGRMYYRKVDRLDFSILTARRVQTLRSARERTCLVFYVDARCAVNRRKTSFLLVCGVASRVFFVCACAVSWLNRFFCFLFL